MTDYDMRRGNGSMRMIVVICNLLTIVGFGLIGVIIAYLKRGEAYGTLWETHITYIIRTFWLGVLGIVVAGLTSFIGIGILLGLVVALWWLIRSVNSLLKAIDDRPIHNPETWLI
ncbi:DUF4870 family protein [Niveispirillum cyanobacteriorum]|uniref:Uncharacterized protein n=1 Tax=Niveispirillum cyanobacteriorum TaxID=1612173 RepID=A0A2K9NE19_9PROT|nr:hypothetical protein [Niveispirillum cyanobacteriorum]AUN31391.1 hypothetical protein C0V82_14945 [Niveispirillum cyanobacteriorum]GGE71561.1 membrane protein [Niveispirillum cyanobacteriorum]